MTREEQIEGLLLKAIEIQKKLSNMNTAEAIEILNLAEALVRASSLYDIQPDVTRINSDSDVSDVSDVSDKQEYLDRESLVEYLGITISQYYSQRLWEKIPNTKLGKTQIYKCKVVDWYMMQNSGEDIKDDQIHSRYLKYLKGNN